MVMCYYNGCFVPIQECLLPVTDLAIQRGVGVFESIRIYDGRPFALSLHLERLRVSADGLGIDAGKIIHDLPGIIRQGLEMPEIRGLDGLIKTYVTGGDVKDGTIFPSPRFFVIFDDEIRQPTDEDKEKGVTLLPNYTMRPNPLIKSTNYLLGIIPMLKAATSDYEALYITSDGEITEALSSNFFLYKNGRLLTAPVGRVLKGVTRDIVITLAKESGLCVEERCPREGELAEADEAFITGTMKEILSVVRVGTCNIGNGQPGPIVRELRHIFIDNMARWMDW